MTIQEKCVNAVRILSAEAITKANSGHPGICLGAAPVAFELFADFLSFSNTNPKWDNRDRFILSAGHGSMLLYSLLHIFGYNVTKEDLASFRQFKSKTPGHPEYGVTDGVEVSTGPLGQGIANAVGMAVAEAHLAAKFNRDGYPIVDHYTYVLCGEGCLEEGISYEACSFAGTQKLGKLILIYDKNDISIEGDVATAFTEDVAKRFDMQGWQVIEIEDGNDLGAVKSALALAKSTLDTPSILICKSKIGYGSPLEGTAAIHGAPLSAADLQKTKDTLGWTEAPFEIPEDVKKYCLDTAKNKQKVELAWNTLLENYKAEYPELYCEYLRYMNGECDKIEELANLLTFEKPEASRISGGKVINHLAPYIPNLLSGSADLAPSTKTDIKSEGYFSPENRAGRNIHFGIREHAMAAICNGITAHGGLRVICSTFFTFSDYMKGAMRMSAIMKLPVLYVLTHDSIGVSEDGPTHQPVEQLASLRTIPGFKVYRPCDGKETAYAFVSALTGNEPTAIVLSRQNLPQYDTSGNKALNGGYIIDDCDGNPDVLLIASGSEVGLCSEAKKILSQNGISARVVSMTCMETFNNQNDEYKESVLPKAVKKRICVEAAHAMPWYQYAGTDGKVIAMTTFGECGPSDILFNHFGITANRIANEAKGLFYKNM